MGKEENKDVNEVKEAKEDVKEKPASQNEDVSDEELEAASGGFNTKTGIRDKNRVDN